MSAIVMWCLPWPYFSDLFSVSSMQLVSQQQIEASTVLLAAKSIQVNSLSADEYLFSSLVLLMGLGFLLYLAQLYQHRQFCRDALSHAKNDLSLEQRYGGEILRVKTLRSAMLIGFWKPVILLPSRAENEQALEFMIQHELVHRKHKDHWRVAILSLLQSLFFWNPLLRLLINKQRNFIEARCDAQVAAKNPGAYRETLSRMALQAGGFDMSCSTAMGNLMWRLKRMESESVQKKATALNVGFLVLLLTMLSLTVTGLLGSSQVLALSSDDAGAVVELKMEMSWSSEGMADSSVSDSKIWLHYDEAFELSFDNDFQMHLTLTKKEDDTVLISTKLLKLNKGSELLMEPQLLVLMGEEAVIEIGNESDGWAFAAVFKVTDAPQPKDVESR
ncbi:M56 family metallopeptidase [Pseudoteredinibacter isoporae]|uniref:Beta-lactamase regulating signal transducer with metallopeptidase domain n=2 Tax=Pseudoteredinibacter isoporae TaxID=570281 RepID=A0A7X0JRD6_9GAMM|nr:M56 family metallopeptidase [Pseudoteredinibacter isoporae]MBB6520888.1 beta-lactamase regulating signal transducer with metallopeptidase domain [Pseudoteredinibacter isoporae]NHO86453.1 M56 family metallopeptidase [Pseudoteredinibacter isoporae]